MRIHGRTCPIWGLQLASWQEDGLWWIILNDLEASPKTPRFMDVPCYTLMDLSHDSLYVPQTNMLLHNSSLGCYIRVQARCWSVCWKPIFTLLSLYYEADAPISFVHVCADRANGVSGWVHLSSLVIRSRYASHLKFSTTLGKNHWINLPIYSSCSESGVEPRTDHPWQLITALSA